MHSIVSSRSREMRALIASLDGRPKLSASCSLVHVTESAGATKTTIYYRGGQSGAQNKSDAAYVAQTYFKGAAVKKLDPSLESLVPATASIVILVGSDAAQSLVA